MRRVDSRFPETDQDAAAVAATSSSKRKSGGAPPIPELKEHFSVLFQRIIKEGYLALVKDSHDSTTEEYEFGPRFHNEIDRKLLVRSYFQCLGQQPDSNLLKEIDEDAKKKDDADQAEHA